MTKEDIKEYNRAYQKANKESISLKRKEYRLENKERLNEYSRAYREANKSSFNDGFYTLYYLPMSHYVGITNNYSRRLREHKSRGKSIDGCEVIYTYKTKREALDMECKFHEVLGYNGINKANFKTK